MNKTANIAIATLAGFAIVSVFQSSTVGAQADRTVAQGVYSAAQATRGAEVYKTQCAECHGEDLKGNDVVPALNDKAFWGFWGDKTVGELYEKINGSMPATSPGTLTPAQTADVIAHILSTLKFPAGTTELSSKLEELKPIKLAQPAM